MRRIYPLYGPRPCRIYQCGKSRPYFEDNVSSYPGKCQPSPDGKDYNEKLLLVQEQLQTKPAPAYRPKRRLFSIKEDFSMNGSQHIWHRAGGKRCFTIPTMPSFTCLFYRAGTGTLPCHRLDDTHAEIDRSKLFAAGFCQRMKHNESALLRHKGWKTNNRRDLKMKN